jgi:hypothetical protein
MERLPLTVTLISIAVAFVLWYVAYSLESDTRWLPADADSQEQPGWLRPANDTPVRSADAMVSCMDTEEELRASVQQARACSTNSDCTLFDYGYPIQCMTSVAKTRITPLRLAFRNYEQQCEFRVYYDCPTGEMDRRPVCINNMCAVELSGTEILTEETLDYLGIDP